MIESSLDASVFKPRLNRRLTPQQLAAGAAIAVWKVAQVLEPVNLAPWVPAFAGEERVHLDDLFDTEPLVTAVMARNGLGQLRVCHCAAFLGA